MRKDWRWGAWALAVLVIAGTGWALAAETPSPASSAAVRLDVNLNATPAPTNAAEAMEPEERPDPGIIEVEIIRPETTVSPAKPLRVLIYHTHTYEAYEPDFADQYTPTERWRTKDNRYNLVAVGAELARLLREEYGMEVVHDDTAFEPPVLSSAYQRSLEALENYAARGEPFDLYLDLHRDAYIEGLFKANTVTVDGQPTARLMFLIGKGTGTYQGQAFAQMPDWERNFSRAQVLADAINLFAKGETLCRQPSLKSSRYNQHISTGALLVEVGNNMNSLDEALRAVPYLARALAETWGGTAPIVQDIVGDK
ncbi:MAG: stage II sporulation protein P [Oscillospiraceae bacterium]|jgi:stage II sporulation protein P|nr:stage II sporulation protein P [Oscillospiraceae bacterium]